MNKHLVIMMGIGAQLVLILFHIYQNGNHMKHAYLKQKNERTYRMLFEHKNDLLRTLENLKSPSAIKTYALNKHMVEIRLPNIQRLSALDGNNNNL